MKGKTTKNVVIVADDDLFVRKVIHAALADLADIIEVDDGKDVANAYEKHEPDVVFLDIHLPHMSGLDLIEPIKALDANAYIIMVSADSSPDNVKAAQAKGSKGFLTKPFTKERILHLFNACPTIKFSD